jgi:hypothetical protein
VHESIVGTYATFPDGRRKAGISPKPDIASCRATFRATVEQYPKSRIRLRNRALVMEEHKPE